MEELQPYEVDPSAWYLRTLFGLLCTAAQASPVEAEPFLRPAFSCVFEHVSLFALQSSVSTVLYFSLIQFMERNFCGLGIPGARSPTRKPGRESWVGGLWPPASLAS